MQDEHSVFKPLDPGRIHALDPFEVAYWCKELTCTEPELTAAVAEVRQALHEMQRRR